MIASSNSRERDGMPNRLASGQLHTIAPGCPAYEPISVMMCIKFYSSA